MKPLAPKPLSDKKPLLMLSRESSATLMGDMIIAMLPLLVMACYFYGYRPVSVTLAAVITCKIADMFGNLLSRRQLMIADLAPIVTGMMIAMLLPASIPFYIPVAASLFAVLVVKQPFGGTGNNLFNPAAAGFAFAAACWPADVSRYPQPLERLEAAAEVSVRLMEGSAYTLKLGGVPSIEWQELVLGNYAGPMGATHILVMMTCLIYLLVRKTVDWRLPAGFLFSAAFIAFFFARIPTSPINSVCFELFSGSVMFFAVYMVGDPVTSPKTRTGRLIYGLLAGALTMILRYYGGFEQGGMFALLMLNAFSYTIDRSLIAANGFRRRAFGEIFKK